MMRKGSERDGLINGATGGPGPAVVAAFERLGRKVVRGNRSDEDSSQRWFDATDRGSVRRAVSSDAMSSYAQIDALMNLVGMWKPQPGIADASDDLRDEFLSINLRTAFLISRAVVPHMLDRRWGRIKNAGASAREHGTAGNVACPAAKAGVLALAESMADEFKGSSVTVDAVVLSVIDTPANRKSMSDADLSKWVPPEHIAATMLFLYSDEAANITGERVRMFNRS